MPKKNTDTGTNPGYTVRIPIAIANEMRTKKDAFSKRVVAAIGKVDRPNWGPEVECSQKEVDFLTEMASGYRKDPATPAKLLSAANKLISIIRELAREAADTDAEPKPHTKHVVGEKFVGTFGKAWGELNLNPIDPVTAGNLDTETGTVAMRGGAARTLDEVMIATMNTNPAAAAMGEIVRRRRSAIIRLNTLIGIFEDDRPGIASVLKLILDDVQAL